MFKAAVEYTMG